MFEFGEKRVIASVSTEKDFRYALKSSVRVIFLLRSNVFTLHSWAEAARQANKTLLVHADMTEGIAKDEVGIAFIAKSGAAGIISTRGNLIKAAKKEGLYTVQRFFAIDFQAVETAMGSVKALKPDMIEILPGVVLKLIPLFKANFHAIVIMGGLIETKQEVIESLNGGADAVSTSQRELWE